MRCCNELSERLLIGYNSCQRGYNDCDTLQANLSIYNRFSIDMYKIRNMVFSGTTLSFLISIQLTFEGGSVVVLLNGYWLSHVTTLFNSDYG